MKKTGKTDTNLLFILVRYIIALFFGVFLDVFYIILTPLTILPAFFILSLFYNASIAGSSILLNNTIIELVEACIAGSAYYLLLILNLSTPMKPKTRIKSILFSFLSLLIINIIRIVIFSIMFIEGFSLFNLTHKIFWYALSILFVVGIWILNIFLFKIKTIPIYSDMENIINCCVKNPVLKHRA